MLKTANFRLKIQYDGRLFCGWQRQPNGLTVQQCIEDACERISGAQCNVHGAGRTDAGVHALGQVANVVLTTSMTEGKIKRALNSILPEEIRITSLRRASETFHARKSAIEKTYRYLLLTSSDRSPFAAWYASWLPHRLEADRMREAAVAFVGRHDFRSFQAAGSSVKSTVREIRRFEIRTGGAMISFTVSADGFLRHMVRIMVGTLIEVGRGKVEPSAVAGILSGRDRKLAGPTAPPDGLTLMRVDY